MTAEARQKAAHSPSTFTLLRTTPLRDLIRGRLSGRLNVEGIIAAGQLPVLVAGTVRQVVRRTRLWKVEKADLASELVAHFQDGLEAGATANELVGGFGDVRRAARLMRRAKIRNRGPLWKARSILYRTLGTIFLLLVAIYLVQAVRVFTAKPVLKLNVLETLNAAALATPESERAWPVYRAGALATRKPPKDMKLQTAHPGDKDWAAAVAYVHENAGVLEQYRAAAAMPKIGIVFSTQLDPELEFRFASDRERKLAEAKANAARPEANPLSISILLPQLATLREAAQMLRIDALAAAEDRDGQRATSDIIAMLGVVDHVEQMPFLISDLVSLAVLNMTTETTGRLMSAHAELFSDGQLVELSHRIAAARGGRLAVDIGCERMCFEDVLQRLYSDNGAGDGILIGAGTDLLPYMTDGQSASSIPPIKLAAPALSLVVAGRADIQAKYDEILNLAVAESHEPLWLRGKSQADADAAKLASSPWKGMRYLPVAILMPSLSRAGIMGWLTVQRRDATLTAISLELYHRGHGDWPASLDLLAPRFIPAVPVDQFDGKPLKYRIVDGRPLVYSVGADRKDDDGRIDAGPNGDYRASQWAPPEDVAAARQDPDWCSPTRSTAIADGDWVLWPPVD